jgi:ATP-binding cassette, subfamily B, bacterial
VRGHLPHRGRAVALVGVAGVVGGLAESVVLVTLVRVALELNDGTARPAVGMLPSSVTTGELLMVAGGLSVVAIVAHLLGERIAARLGAEALLSSRRALFAAFLRADPEHRSTLPVSHLSDTASNLATSMSALVFGYCSVVGSALALVPVLVVAGIVDPVATTVVIGLAVAVSVATRPLLVALRERVRRHATDRERLVEVTAQWSQLASETRVFGVEPQVDEVLSDRARDASLAMQRARHLNRAVNVARSDVVLLLLVTAVAVLYWLDPVSLASVGTVVVLLLRALRNAQGLQRAVQEVHAVTPEVELFLGRIEALDAARRDVGGLARHDVGVVEVREVHYRYPTSGDQPHEPGPVEERMALRGVSVAVRPGEVVAIVGPSGGGKSTLIQVLLRLRRPLAGAVLVDGVDAADIDDDDWAGLVSGVPQDPQLIEGTIADNIRFLRAEIDDQRIVESARRAHVHDEVTALPHGYATRLGPRGSGLSGGQRQRIALARALAGHPRVLVLDEPTSALDPLSEERIRRTLVELRPELAIVVVAHRPALVEIADRVIRIDDGRVVEDTPGEEVRS